MEKKMKTATKELMREYDFYNLAGGGRKRNTSTSGLLESRQHQVNLLVDHLAGAAGGEGGGEEGYSLGLSSSASEWEPQSGTELGMF
ncbi:unnamed protein product [Amoebophrya sp. A25]|nr:unnamed protein product [Amoebophrya sp. A25]|eukprot:GSA25T00020912001.1